MTLSDGAEETVDLVEVVGASTLPSPARRCPLQLNPFLDPERPRPFRVFVYNSQGKFQRVVMDGTSDNFPAQLHFQKDISMATSEESAWELNSLASLSSDAHINLSSSSRTCSMVPGQETDSNGENITESCFVPKNGKENAGEEAKEELSAVNVLDSNVWMQHTTTCVDYTKMHVPSGSPRSIVSTTNLHALERNTEIGFKRFGADAQRPHPSATSKNESAENNASSAANMTHNNGGDNERNLSKKESLRKLLSLGRGGSDEVPSRKNSLRKMLRKTSRTLLGNILDGGKSVEVDADNERQAVLEGKRSTLHEDREQKREVKKGFKAHDSGVRSVPNGGGSTWNDKEFEKIIMRHALHVEKYLDDLVSP